MGQDSFTMRAVKMLMSVFVGIIIGNSLMAIVLLLSGVTVNNLTDVYALFENPNFVIPAKIGLGLSHIGTFILSSWIYLRWQYGVTFFNKIDVRSPFRNQTFLLLLAWLLIAYPAIAASGALFSFIDLPDWIQTSDDEQISRLMSILYMDSPMDLLINLIIVALLPAIGEELLFRGVLQMELLKRLINPHIAIVLTAAIFSAVHLQVEGFLPKFGIGIIVGYAYYWTRHIAYPMLLHGLNNSLPLISLYIAGENIDPEKATQDMTPFAGLLLFGLISSFAAWWYGKNIEPKVAYHGFKA